ncbi:MAG: glycosyltransferase [Variovorax sp.]
MQADELAAALDAMGLAVRTFDYRKNVQQVSAALADPNCCFFVCFSGFGSELLLTSGAAGYLIAAFEHFKKPLFDLMIECPAHEEMRHQIESTGGMRHLLLTDPCNAYAARLLGVESVRTVRGIVFPKTIGASIKPWSERSVGILLPIDTGDAEQVRRRHETADTYKSRTFREIFEGVAEYALSDLRVDPMVQTLIACQDIGIPADFRNRDLRFLLSSVIDYVGAARNQCLIEAIEHLPVTVVGSATPLAGQMPTALRFIDAPTPRELLAAVTDAKVVVCPFASHSGARLRAMAAFTAGAAVMAAPDEILETAFVHGKHMLTYRSFEELARFLEQAIHRDQEVESLAIDGQARALDQFSPHILASTMLSIARVQFPPEL